MLRSKSALILLVEDNQMDAELIQDAFREMQSRHILYVVSTGTAALDYLLGKGEFADRARYPLPALILLDLKLPGLDGHEVLQRIKAMPLLKRVPVIIFTSSVEEIDRARSYDSGANSYLMKPPTFDGYLTFAREVESYWLRLNAPPPLVENPSLP